MRTAQIQNVALRAFGTLCPRTPRELPTAACNNPPSPRVGEDDVH